MNSLITFATHWGSRFGGINSFNTDFLEAFGNAYYLNVQVVCIVAAASSEEIEKARNEHVTLLPLPYPLQHKTFTKDLAQTGINLLKQENIVFDPTHTIWLGHDRITGAAAIEAAKLSGGRSAVIHHMSYDHYESFAENSAMAYAKTQEQRGLFKQADLVLGIGPLLRDAAKDLIGDTKTVHMLVPGLAEIDASSTPKTFSAFMSGRLDKDAARIKQGHLGIAAFALAHKRACELNMPGALCKQPNLMLRGVDFAAEITAIPAEASPETELKLFAEKYADRAINLKALPYTEDRQELYGNLSRSSVAMMPSWHEGFGLVGWEAIAAGVPLIISKNSGVYQLLEEIFPELVGCVQSIDVRGSNADPFFQPEDQEAVAEALKEIARDQEAARKKAAILRGKLLEKYRWPLCAEEAAKVFGWDLQMGFPVVTRAATPITTISEQQLAEVNLPVHMPVSRLKSEGILSDSQLLRAEEALVPFDRARQPDLDMLNDWLDQTSEHPIALRLLTGAGGLGKTRLALELCQQRNKSGWYAGFLDSELETKQLATSWKNLQALKQPLLIVIDYAETRQETLLSLTRAMLQTRAESHVRVLLLARDGGEWWDNLPGKNKDCEALLSSYATSGPYDLSPLHQATQERHAAYREALQAFAQVLNVPAPETIPKLEGEHYGRPLYLHMAALLALRGERPATAQGLTRALLNHERRYWHGLFSNKEFVEPERYAEQLLALATLAGGLATDRAAWPYWERAYGRVLNNAQFRQLFHALMPLYPAKQGLQAVRPDVLGEALVAQALSQADAKELLDEVLGNKASGTIRQHALTVIARLSNRYEELHEVLIDALVRHLVHCWQEFIHVAAETPSSLPALAETAFTKLQPTVLNQLVGVLGSSANNESVQLAGFYCQVNEFLVDMAYRKQQKKASDIDVESSLARSLNNYSLSLFRNGRNDEALAHADQALEIFRRLAEKKPERFHPDYATSLNNYASYLGEAGRNEEALEHAKQALEIRRRLAENNHDRFDPRYAAVAEQLREPPWRGRSQRRGAGTCQAGAGDTQTHGGEQP